MTFEISCINTVIPANALQTFDNLTRMSSDDDDEGLNDDDDEDGGDFVKREGRSKFYDPDSLSQVEALMT